jgi:hypothetical protein
MCCDDAWLDGCDLVPSWASVGRPPGVRRLNLSMFGLALLAGILFMHALVSRRSARLARGLLGRAPEKSVAADLPTRLGHVEPGREIGGHLMRSAESRSRVDVR